MSTTILRDAVLMAGACVCAVMLFVNKDAVMEMTGLSSPERFQSTGSPEQINMAGESDSRLTGQVVSLPKQPDGHFWTHARVNRGMVKFMVDTGASIIALTPDDAKKAGIRMQDLEYTQPIDTAGGRIYAAGVTLDRVAVGSIILDDVEAVVIQEGLTSSLLGMSFLGRLQKVEANPQSMILRR